MELSASPDVNFLPDEQTSHLATASVLPEVVSLQEELLNFVATFTAGNGAELHFEFHCSNAAEAHNHVEELANYLKKDVNFLNILGERWNAEPDQLKRVIMKRKMELVFSEFEVIDSALYSVKPFFQ